MKTDNLIAKKSIIVATIMVISSILGLLRETIVASQFGAGVESDAYFVAQTIPSLVTNVVNVGVVSSFVTVYSGFILKGEREKAKDTTNSLLTIFGIGLTIVVVFIVFKSEFFISLIAKSYQGEILVLSSNLLKIMSISIVFSGFIAVLVGINNSNNSFIAPSSIGLVMNVVMIIGTISLSKIFGIYSLAISLVIGILFQFIIQIPSAIRQGLKFSFNFNIKDEGVRAILIMIFPFLFTAIINQVNLVVDRNLASTLEEGIISSMYYAGKLMALPQNILSSALGMVILPVLVMHIINGEKDSAMDTIIKSIRLITLIVFPIIILFNIFSQDIISILFGHGKFTERDIIITSQLIPYYFGVVYFGAIWGVLSKIYFANKKTGMIVITSLISVISKVIFSYILFNKMNAQGLVLSDSLAALTAVIFMIIQMEYNLKFRGSLSKIKRFIKEFIIKNILIMISLYIVGKGLKKFIYYDGTKVLIQCIYVGSVSIVILLIYYILLTLFKINEIVEINNKGKAFIIKLIKKHNDRGIYEK